MTKFLSPALRITPCDLPNHDIAAYFAPLANQPWAMLLQSAAPSHPDNRFDILVADPLLTLTHHDGVNQICWRDGKTKTQRGDPFVLLDALCQQYLPQCEPIAPWPFLGGALGYFGYDLGRQLESLPQQAIDDVSLPDMAVGLYDWALIVDKKNGQTVVIEPKCDDRLSWLRAQQTTHQAFHLASSWQANMDCASYQQKFNQVQAYLAAGDCYQINLAQRFAASYQGSEWLAYQRLVKQNAAPFSAFIRLEQGAILSLSPERFLKLDQRQIETKPIKGTRQRSSDPAIDAQLQQDLATAAKDRAENVMIVDLLRNDIGRVAAAGSVQVPHLFAIESFPAVHHLVSTVTASLDAQYRALDLLRACFPGGSITGAPKVRAMQIIEELEPHRRSVYCGAIGYISRCQTMDTNISIRTLVCSQQKIYAWAGGGVVADSEVDAEYQETLDKLSKILPTLTQQQAYPCDSALD